jgi:hypothetical protein
MVNLEIFFLLHFNLMFLLYLNMLNFYLKVNIVQFGSYLYVFGLVKSSIFCFIFNNLFL